MGRVEVVGAELWRVPLRLRSAVGTSRGEHAERPVLYVVVHTPCGEGWGESPALPWTYGADASCSMVEALLRHHLAALVGSKPALRGVREAGACLEMALLDASLHHGQQSLAAFVGARPRAAVGAVLGIPKSRDVVDLVAAAGALWAQGWPRLRVKIAPGWDHEPLAALRGALPQLALLADANGAYATLDRSAARAALERLDGLGLACIEQPLAPWDLGGHAAVARALRTPIGLDESLSSSEALRRALDLQALEVACLKPARLGGVVATLAALQICSEAGVGAFIGGFFETGLGRSVSAALAACPEATWPSDVGPPSAYLEDPCSFPPSAPGAVEVWSAPGVGPRPDRRRLAELGGVVTTFGQVPGPAAGGPPGG